MASLLCIYSFFFFLTWLLSASPYGVFGGIRKRHPLSLGRCRPWPEPELGKWSTVQILVPAFLCGQTWLCSQQPEQLFHQAFKRRWYFLLPWSPWQGSFSVTHFYSSSPVFLFPHSSLKFKFVLSAQNGLAKNQKAFRGHQRRLMELLGKNSLFRCALKAACMSEVQMT